MSNLVFKYSDNNCPEGGNMYQFHNPKGVSMKRITFFCLLIVLFLTAACKDENTISAQAEVQKHKITSDFRDELVNRYKQSQPLFKTADGKSAIEYYWFDTKQLFPSMQKYKDGVMKIQFGKHNDGTIAVIVSFKAYGTLLKSLGEEDIYQFAGACPPGCL